MKYTLGKQIYDGVKKDILTGVYKPNTILSEGGVAQHYGVSKSPVKKALHDLCDAGYLINYARKGYLVVNTNDADYSKLQQVRYAIEALTVSQLVRFATPEDIRELKRIANLKEPTDPAYTTVNAQFHMAMAELTGNNHLVHCLRYLISEISLAYSYLETKNMPLEEQDCHLQLLEAIEARDRSLALKLLMDDLNDDRISSRYEIIPYII